MLFVVLHAKDRLLTQTNRLVQIRLVHGFREISFSFYIFESYRGKEIQNCSLISNSLNRTTWFAICYLTDKILRKETLKWARIVWFEIETDQIGLK